MFSIFAWQQDFILSDILLSFKICIRFQPVCVQCSVEYALCNSSERHGMCCIAKVRVTHGGLSVEEGVVQTGHPAGHNITRELIRNTWECMGLEEEECKNSGKNELWGKIQLL